MEPSSTPRKLIAFPISATARQDRSPPLQDIDSWHPALHNRPDFFKFNTTTLSAADRRDLKSFNERRSAYLNVEIHTKVDHDDDTLARAMRYRDERELKDDMHNAEVIELEAELSQLDEKEVDFIEEFYEKQDWLYTADELYIRIMLSGTLLREIVDEALTSGDYPKHQALLEALAADPRLAGYGQDLWIEFRRKRGELRLRVPAARLDARDVEEEALKKWWEIVLIR